MLHALDTLGLTAALTTKGQAVYGSRAQSELPDGTAPDSGALFLVVGHRQTEEYSLQGRAFRLLEAHDLVRRYSTHQYYVLVEPHEPACA